jgi:hypothetical protein
VGEPHATLRAEVDYKFIAFCGKSSELHLAYHSEDAVYGSQAGQQYCLSCLLHLSSCLHHLCPAGEVLKLTQ